MRVLLDTHTLLWALEDNPRLSRRAAELLGDPETERLVSAVSAYEVCFKFAIGKLPSAAALAEAFTTSITEADFVALPISVQHAEAAGKLRVEHRDPFDRLLIAQARLEQVPLISNDVIFDRFGVDRLW